jgi:hypothetical protein
MNTAPNPSFGPDEGFRFLYLFDGPQVFLKSNQAVQILEPDAEDYFSRIFAAGSSISAVNQVAVNNFIVGCKADGIWSAIKACCLLAGPDTLAGALVPLVGPEPTNVNGNFVMEDYNRITGLMGNGLNKHLNTNVNWRDMPQNDSHLSAWISEVNITTSTPKSVVAGSATSGNGSARVSITGEGIGDALNMLHTATSANIVNRTPSIGLYGISRSNNNSFDFREGGGGGTLSRLSTTPQSNQVHIFSGRNGEFWGGRASFYSIGESLDLALLDARIITYMASIQ